MSTDYKINKIIFCDSIPEIEKGEDILYVAMKPKVYAYLKQKGVLVHNTLPYFTNESHEYLLKKSNILMKWVRSHAGFVDLGIGVKDAYEHILTFWLRLAIHYCLWVIEVVRNVTDKYQPKSVIVCSPIKKHISTLYIVPEDGYLAYLVDEIAKAKGIKYKYDQGDFPGKNTLSSSSTVNSLAGTFKFLRRYVMYKFFEMIFQAKKLFGKKLIFFSISFYQMNKIAQHLKSTHEKRLFYFLRLPLLISPKLLHFFIKIFGRRYLKSYEIQKNIVAELIKKIKNKCELFSFQEVSFANLISDKIEMDIGGFVLSQTLWSFFLSKHLKKINPIMVVSNGSRLDEIILAELCQKNSITNVLISHGSHVRPKNEYEKIEWGEHGRQFLSAPVSHIAMPTPSSEGYLDAFPSKANVIKTGPLTWGTPVDKEISKLIFDRLFNGRFAFRDVKVVLHAGTPKADNGLRLYVYETSDEYIQAICDLAQAVERLPNTVLVIKFRPSQEIDIDTLKNLVPISKKVVLCVNDSFLDILGIADLLVSFSSTSIDEALQNRIPVLLYGGGGRYQFIPASQIMPNNAIRPSAIYHSKKAEHLENAVRRILDFNIKDNYSSLFDKYIYPMKNRRSLLELL